MGEKYQKQIQERNEGQKIIKPDECRIEHVLYSLLQSRRLRKLAEEFPPNCDIIVTRKQKVTGLLSEMGISPN